jgi:hypothetical protein
MSSIRNWFRGTPSSNANNSEGSTPVETVDQNLSTAHSHDVSDQSAVDREARDVADAMAAVGQIMNDDIDGAEARLSQDTVFHQLGLGIAKFMRSILGFEKEIMAQASSLLLETETKASAELKRAQRATTGGGWFGRGVTEPSIPSHAYPAGTQYALVGAQAQLMGAIVAVMHESLAEALKGFYKLRKAYITLDGIKRAEEQRFKTQTSDSNGTVRRPSLAGRSSMPGSFNEAEFAELAMKDKGELQDENADESDMEFVDAKEGLSGTQTPANYAGHLTAEPESSTAAEKVANGELSRQATQTEDGMQPNAEFLSDPINVFIFSGASMTFGLLLLIISMVPPAMSRLLSVIGFRGDRDRGVRMLWQSTRFPNVNGAVAGLALLSYYNGLMSFSDILPSDSDIEALAAPGEVAGYPRQRLEELLATMREHYPESRLWQLEEARSLANRKRLADAINLLRVSQDSRMRQVTALVSFELSLDAMYTMDWALMRDSFLRCIQLNDWLVLGCSSSRPLVW